MLNQQLADEHHKTIIRKFKRRKAYSSFKYNIWGAYLADIQLISTYSKWIRFLLYGIDIFSKYTWFVPWIGNAFKVILNNSKRKANKILGWLMQWIKRQWQRNVFNIQWRKVWFCCKIYQDFKNKIYKHMTAVSTNGYFNVWDDIVDK